MKMQQSLKARQCDGCQQRFRVPRLRHMLEKAVFNILRLSWICPTCRDKDPSSLALFTSLFRQQKREWRRKLQESLRNRGNSGGA